MIGNIKVIVTGMILELLLSNEKMVKSTNNVKIEEGKMETFGLIIFTIVGLSITLQFITGMLFFYLEFLHL